MKTDAIRKVQAADFDAFDWDWNGRYYQMVVRELAETFSLALISEFPEARPEAVQFRASKFAEAHAGDMLRLDAPGNLVELTRARTREIVSAAIEEGQSVQTVAKTLREDFAFSKSRSNMIARTETAKALGEGAMGAAKEQNRNEKRWITSGDLDEPEQCLLNEKAGWISIGDTFPGGTDTVPQHPNCRCNVNYRTHYEEETLRTISEVRCPKCNRLIARNFSGLVELACDRCGERFSATSR
jgi:hypothetical protein